MALNGQVLTTPAVKVEPGDILTVDGEVVDAAEPTRLFRYHKPVDLLTTHRDPQGRPTVFDALPPGLPRLISIGRLDINSEGLLLLTNDGELARALEQPTTGIVRRYRVRARGRVTQADLDKLQDGVTVEGVKYGPIDAKIDKAKDGPQGANVWITVTLAEGKNREVRRVLKSVGLEVGRLIRMSYGPFVLGSLPIGQIEEVGPRVIREQLAEHIAPENLPNGDRPSFKAPKAPAGAHAVHDGTGRRGAGARPEGEAEAKKKPAYKEGWARPKVEIKSPAVKRRRAPRPGEEQAPAVPVAPRRRSSRIPGDTPGSIRTYSPGDPLAPPPPARPAPKRKAPPRAAAAGPARTERFEKGPRREGPPRGDGPRTKGATLIERGPRNVDGKPARPRGAAGPRGEGRGDAPRAWGGPPRGPRSDAPRGERSARPDFRGEGRPPREGRPEGRAEGRPPRDDTRPRSGPPKGPPKGRGGPGGPRFDGPRSAGPRSEGPRHDGPRPSGPRAGGPRSGGPRSGPRPGGPRGPKRDD
ncbi:23S rRNA pseudouridine2605 synthase [Phenylobacterium koreense]|uniref:Pseudouridine synthase n=1 Tax=Phenylobacterium koreense TaxID=266125 RepID=A0ABV2EIV3_9CAUL